MGTQRLEKKRVAKVTTVLGVTLLIFGAGFYIFNYERQSIQVENIVSKTKIIDYRAPTWDPLPHHVKVRTDSAGPIDLTVTISDANPKTETFKTSNGERTFHVQPGETIEIYVENPDSFSGTVKTVLWCDSWNYVAAILAIGGIVLLLI
jgi:hypothetical protein